MKVEQFFKGMMLFRFSTIHGSNDNPATAASSNHYYYLRNTIVPV